MPFNPMFDTFVECGYLGYSLRAVAHRQNDETYRPFLEILDYRYGEGEILYESMFDELYTGADPALSRALGKGHQVIDHLLELMKMDETADA